MVLWGARHSGRHDAASDTRQAFLQRRIWVLLLVSLEAVVEHCLVDALDERADCLHLEGEGGSQREVRHVASIDSIEIG